MVAYGDSLKSYTWSLFTSQFHQTDRECIAAGDEKEAHGLGRFFSSLQNRVVPGLSFFVFSLIDVQERESYPIQAALLNREFASPIKVVVILKPNLSSTKQAYVILLSTDLELSCQKHYDYYILRFQIEFNFRDASNTGVWMIL